MVQPRNGPTHPGAFTSGALMNSEELSSNLRERCPDAAATPPLCTKESTESDDPVAAAAASDDVSPLLRPSVRPPRTARPASSSSAGS